MSESSPTQKSPFFSEIPKKAILLILHISLNKRELFIMSERVIEGLNFGGETIWIEVSEVEQKGRSTNGDEFEKVSAAEELAKAGDRVRSTITALARTVQVALEDVGPKEWTLEVNIGFKGAAGIPFVTSGEANGAVKVTAKWTR
jgi:hypothetical protein